MSELKDCPFCGGRAEIYKECSYSKTGGYDAYIAKCDTCGAEINECEILSHDEAVAMWNRRCIEVVSNIVLCKDCKYAVKPDDKPNMQRCSNSNWYMEDNDFCSRGVKREEVE